MRKSLAATLSLLVLAGLALPVPAPAQDDRFGASFITPFPEDDVYQMQVVGDWFASGLRDGLAEAFGGDTRLKIPEKHVRLNGLMQSEFEAAMQDFAADFGQQRCDIAVVMLGSQDRVPLRNESGKRVAVGTDDWRAMYARRVDRFMKVLKKRNIAIYWVGLPNLRNGDANAQAEIMNDIIRERAYLNGEKYIDAYASFADEQGSYNPYGPDLTGKIRLLRERDGVFFTYAGYRKLAHFVEREVKRDLTQAKNERTVPLAGAEAEQARVLPAKAIEAAPGGAQAGAGEPAAQGGEKSGTSSRVATASPAATGDQKADNSRISLKTIGPSGQEEIISLDIVRPAISGSVVALVTRKESPDRASQMGDVLVDQIEGGLTVMSSVTPPGDRDLRRKTSPTQAPYYRLLVRGERLMPKPGRADDLVWPPPPPPQITEIEEPRPGGRARRGAPEKAPRFQAPAPKG